MGIYVFLRVVLDFFYNETYLQFICKNVICLLQIFLMLKNMINVSKQKNKSNKKLQ